MMCITIYFQYREGYLIAQVSSQINHIIRQKRDIYSETKP